MHDTSFPAEPHHDQLTYAERQLQERLEIRLAVAERDLAFAKARHSLNAVDNALRDVNRFRCQLGLRLEPPLPPHVPDPSLRHLIRVQDNGVRQYRFGFGFTVGQRVSWAHPSKPLPRRAGVVVEIFEYGREPKVVFKPDDGVGWWVAPGDLREEAQRVSDAAAEHSLGPHEDPLSDKLILMPCSAGKLGQPAPAIDLYTGVMWQTFRAQMQVKPRLAILSAKHGILNQAQVVAPYEQLMTEQRAAELLADLSGQASAARRAIGDGPVAEVLLVGGLTYRRVMQGIVKALQADGVIPDGAVVANTVGGIGQQRAQLGAFLRAMPAPHRE